MQNLYCVRLWIRFERRMQFVYEKNKEILHTQHCSFGYPLFTDQMQLQFEGDNFRLFCLLQMQALILHKPLKVLVIHRNFFLVLYMQQNLNFSFTQEKISTASPQEEVTELVIHQNNEKQQGRTPEKSTDSNLPPIFIVLHVNRIDVGKFSGPATSPVKVSGK